MKHIGFGSWIPKRCCLRVAMYQQKLQGSTKVNVSMLQKGSYAEGHVLSSASLWKQVWRGEGGQNAASTDILEKVGKRHTLIATILLLSVRPHRFGPWWKMLLLRDTNIFSDWSCCCLRTMGPLKGVKHPYLFFKEKVLLQYFLLTFIIGKHIRF